MRLAVAVSILISYTRYALLCKPISRKIRAPGSDVLGSIHSVEVCVVPGVQVLHAECVDGTGLGLADELLELDARLHAGHALGCPATSSVHEEGLGPVPVQILGVQGQDIPVLVVGRWKRHQ